MDYLALQTGQKIDFPFMAMIVFATNIAPAELVDEAFLRRIQYKVHADSPTEDDFLAIFERCCQQGEVEFRPREVRRLLETYYRPRGIQLRGCQPRDLLDHAIALARYFDEPFELTCEALERACASYFLEERSPATTV